MSEADLDQMEKSIMENVHRAIRESRNDAINSAIEICEEVMKQGGGAAQCLVSLRRFRFSMAMSDGVKKT